MQKNLERFDVAVIGGGPAGMLAAGRAAELGARVVLLEKNTSLGKKLLITGKGRCNLTQAEFDNRKFIEEIGQKGKFLFSPLAVFGPGEVIEFFKEGNLPTKVERGKRVFPVSDSAQDVLGVLKKYLEKNKVEIMFGLEVLGFEKEGKKIKSIKINEERKLSVGKRVLADKFILATGGKAYPATGSTGSGYVWAKELGHTIVPPRPALAPIEIEEEWISELQGLSLKNVALNLWQNEKKQASCFGEMLFAHFGISGPIVLDVSKKVGELLEKGQVKILLDLKPALTLEQLDARLQRDFEKFGKKDLVNYLPELLPLKMIAVFVKLSGLGERRKMNSISKEERKKMLNLLKNFSLTVRAVASFNQAIVTSGGVNLREVDSKTMQSRIIENLYFAGEILDLDGPTGGYNLQIAWTTGFVAGNNVFQKTNKK